VENFGQKSIFNHKLTTKRNIQMAIYCHSEGYIIYAAFKNRSDEGISEDRKLKVDLEGQSWEPLAQKKL